MPRPSISVVVPNYNHAPYLAQRIRSIQEQTWPPDEILVLDDASTDNSLGVIAAIRDPRLRLIPSERNSGNPFLQWNKGIRAAISQFIWIAESDDWADSGLLSTLVPPLIDDPSLAVSGCNSVIVRGGQVTTETTADWNAILDAERWTSEYRAVGSEEVKSYLARENTLPNASGVVFRKSLWSQVGGVPEHLRYAGDWLFWSRLLLLGNLYYSPAPLNHFRRHPESTTAGAVRSGRLLMDRLEVVRSLLSAVSFPREQRRGIVQHHVDHVFWACLNPLNRTSGRMGIRLTCALLRLDPRSVVRIVRHLVVIGGRSVGRRMGVTGSRPMAL